MLLDEPSDALLELACRQVHCSFLFGTRPDHQKEASVLNNIGIRKTVLLHEPSVAILGLIYQQVHGSFLFRPRPCHQKRIPVLNNINIRKTNAVA